MQAAMTQGHPDFIPDSRVLAAAKEAEALLLAKIAALEGACRDAEQSGMALVL